MKKIFLIFILLSFLSCNKDDNTEMGNSDIDYRQQMRDFVIDISKYSKAMKPDFYVIPQNGIELVTSNGESSGPPDSAYLNAIDGSGQEDLRYGYDNDDIATPAGVTAYLKSFLDISRNNGNTILVTDYCSTHSKMDNSYSVNNGDNYVSFAESDRDLTVIPDYPSTIHNENTNNIMQLSQVKNFIFMINAEKYTTRQDYINAIKNTNYDLIIIDLFFNDGTAFTASEIQSMKNKANGGKRFVICYMSIGEAENYRYYWQDSWLNSKPAWLDAENPDWPGNYKVKYWNTEWQKIIYGNDTSYLKRILDSNYDGVYLDIIDAFEYYE